MTLIRSRPLAHSALHEAAFWAWILSDESDCSFYTNPFITFTASSHAGPWSWSQLSDDEDDDEILSVEGFCFVMQLRHLIRSQLIITTLTRRGAAAGVVVIESSAVCHGIRLDSHTSVWGAADVFASVAVCKMFGWWRQSLAHSVTVCVEVGDNHSGEPPAAWHRCKHLKLLFSLAPSSSSSSSSNSLKSFPDSVFPVVNS